MTLLSQRSQIGLRDYNVVFQLKDLKKLNSSLHSSNITNIYIIVIILTDLKVSEKVVIFT